MIVINHLKLINRPKNNIFEWRNKDYEKFVNAIRMVISKFPYFKAMFSDDYIIDNEIENTDAKALYTEYEIIKDDEVKVFKDTVKLPIPIKHNVLAFQLSGKIRIPVFQFVDDEYYMVKDNVINIVTNLSKYGHVKIINKNPEYEYGDWYYVLSKKHIPISIILIQYYSSLEDFFKDFKLSDFEIVKLNDTPLKKYQSSIQIATNKRLYYTLSSNEFYNSILKQYFRFPLLPNIPMNSFSEYKIYLVNASLTKRILGYHQRAKSLLNYIATKDPYNGSSVLTIIHKLFKSHDILNVKQLSPNDLSNKRIRLLEPLMFKLYSTMMSALNDLNSPNKNAFQNRHRILSQDTIDKALLGELIQFDNSVNPISQLSIFSRITYIGRGGFTKDSASLELRNIHETYKDVVDPIDTPSGGSSGIVNFIIPDIKIDDMGRPFINPRYSQPWKAGDN